MRRTRVLGAIAALAMVAVTACSGSGEDSGGSGSNGAGEDDGTLLVWTTEEGRPGPGAAGDLQKFGQQAGITVKLVAIAEDQLSTVIASAVAAGDRARTWTPTDGYSVEASYNADVYVFCHHIATTRLDYRAPSTPASGTSM